MADTNPPEEVQVSQREALEACFMLFCQQYQQMGEQLKAFAHLLGPIFDGKQKLLPDLPTMVAKDTMEYIKKLKVVTNAIKRAQGQPGDEGPPNVG